MLNELHIQGYQRLRFASGPVPAGGHWRIFITTAEHLKVFEGQTYGPADEDLAAEHRSSWGPGNVYFGWEDTSTFKARELAERFKLKFPRICEEGRGRDWEYAGWFSELVGVAEGGFVPLTNFYDYTPEGFRDFEVHWWGHDDHVLPAPFPSAPDEKMATILKFQKP